MNFPQTYQTLERYSRLPPSKPSSRLSLDCRVFSLPWKNPRGCEIPPATYTPPLSASLPFPSQLRLTSDCGSPLSFLTSAIEETLSFYARKDSEMRKGLHPQMQWISYVTPSGRLIQAMMTRIHRTGKVYHFRARRQIAKSLGQVAKFKRRYGIADEEPEKK